MQDDPTRSSVSPNGPNSASQHLSASTAARSAVGGGDTGAAGRSKCLKLLHPAEVARTLADDPRVVVPVGTCEAYDTALPLGSATIVVERLARDLSAEFGVLLAPTMEYGVNSDTPAYPGRVALRKKTLHRTLNDMLASWEGHGVSEFILLTAHGYDPHQEAMGTVSTVSARVRVVDIFAVNLSDLVGGPMYTGRRGALFLALLRYLAPDLVDHADTPGGAESADDVAATSAVPHAPVTYDAAMGRALYERIRSRISERIFLAPSPVE